MGGLDQEEQLKELGSIIAKTMSEDIKLGVEADLPKWQDSIMKHLKDRLGSTVTLVDQQVQPPDIHILEIANNRSPDRRYETCCPR